MIYFFCNDRLYLMNYRKKVICIYVYENYMYVIIVGMYLFSIYVFDYFQYYICF